MLEIHNKTCVPTSILLSLIGEALKITECKNDNFKIKFTAGSDISGLALKTGQLFVVIPISKKQGINSKIKINKKQLAKEIYLVIVHEIQHFIDFSTGKSMGLKYQRTNDRPCEKWAEAAEKKAAENMSGNLLKNLNEWLKDK
jgi:hypothetical protein